MTKDDRPSDLAEAALALDRELRRFEDLAAQAAKTKLNTEKNVERATEALQRAAESQDRINAHFENGVLTVSIPKSEKVRRRKIEIAGRGENAGRMEAGKP